VWPFGCYRSGVPSRVEVATGDDVSEIIASANALVATDAGRYDAGATDLTWAARSGSAYAASLLANDDSLVLIARDGDAVIGHLVARLHGPGSVHPVRVAELESIHVYPAHRGHGIGEQMMDRFLAWAVDKGAQRASVTVYAANEGARRFYAHHGFAMKSVILHRDGLQVPTTVERDQLNR
jgi:GNAT superfamily N-acetyltransferase